jgi:metal-responsive CopG/Arc/MetJ family transcriptional regulator
MRTLLSVSLPENMPEELDRFAKSTGRNKSEIVKKSLSMFLWEIKLSASSASQRCVLSNFKYLCQS